MDVEYAGEHVPVDETAVVEPTADEPSAPTATPSGIQSARAQTETPMAADSPAPAPSRAQTSPPLNGEKKRKRETSNEATADEAEDEEEDAKDGSADEAEVEEVEDEEAVIDESVQESDCRIIVNVGGRLCAHEPRLALVDG
jgi:hypothetical protein